MLECVELDTSKPLPPKIQLGEVIQDIMYETKVSFCVKCGHVGHFSNTCRQDTKSNQMNVDNGRNQNQDIAQSDMNQENKEKEFQWQKVVAKSFVRRRNNQNSQKGQEDRSQTRRNANNRSQAVSRSVKTNNRSDLLDMDQNQEILDHRRPKMVKILIWAKKLDGNTKMDRKLLEE